MSLVERTETELNDRAWSASGRSYLVQSQGEHNRADEKNDELLKEFLSKPFALWSPELLKYGSLNSSLDGLNYSLWWFMYNRKREYKIKAIVIPFAHSGWEQLRLKSISAYWLTCITHKVSIVTVHLAIQIANTIFMEKRVPLLTRSWFAGVIIVSFRLALKFEERPDLLWSIGQIWELFPLFEAWRINRDEQSLGLIEAQALKILDDNLNIALPIHYLDYFLGIGGWPVEITKEYHLLGHYLLALATFASSVRQSYLQYPPSLIAMSAAVLTVKIINGDRTMDSFEFFPDRLRLYSGVTIKQLQPILKSLSSLLRHKPHDSHILSHMYPEWDTLEWN